MRRIISCLRDVCSRHRKRRSIRCGWRHCRCRCVLLSRRSFLCRFHYLPHVGEILRTRRPKSSRHCDKSTATRFMRGLPLIFVAEVRLAFQSCSRQHVASRKTQFSTFRPLLKKSPPRRKVEAPIQVVHSQLRAQKEGSVSTRGAKDNAVANGQAGSSKDLVAVQEGGRALQDGRKVEVPYKVIPRADITPNLTLSPKERLHIEQLTRNLPPRTEPKGRYISAGL